MVLVDVVVPQMGEGLREVLIRRLLKQPGDPVARDELIYTMETDKADMDVECPYGGVLEEWLVKEGDVVAVGATVARLRTPSTVAVEGPPAAPAPERTPAAPEPAPVPAATLQTRAPGRGILIPPRTRAYCRQLGLSREQLQRIPAAGSTLLPGDVDHYLAALETPAAESAACGKAPEPPAPTATAEKEYQEQPLPPGQRVFNFRLKRSADLVVPATMVRHLRWPRFAAAVEASRRRHPETACSDFEVFAYAVVRAVRDHERFRSTLIGEETVRRYRDVNLGIAVQRLDDDLVTAVVPSADRLELPDFAAAAQRQVSRALEGEDQADASVQLLLSYVSAYEIIDAIPVLVAPATAVVFLGAPHGPPGSEVANLGVTFDHRLINGVGAANFLKAIVAQVEKLASPEAIAEDGGTASCRTTAAILETTPRDELESRLTRLVAEQVAAVAELAPGAISPREPLRNLGLNSRMALALTGRLEQRLGIPLTPILVWSYPTVETLAGHLTKRMAAPNTTSTAKTTPTRQGREASSLLDSIDQLSEEQAEALLASKLKRSD